MRKRYLIFLFLFFSAMCAFAQPVVITPPSANIQPGESVTLRASGAVYYQWSPATGLSATEGPVVVASPTVTTTYTCEGYAPGDESVVNGDFSQGNTGFTSAYEYNSNLWNEGTYYVDFDASLHHENFHGYGHGDNGNFMMVNGAISAGTNVWTEQISVVPNKWYAFSTWACTLAGVAGQMALLQFSINGTQIGDVFSAPAQTMVWEQFYELWYSENATTATITILNQNTNGDGNDFGLDDISFRELVLVGSPTCTVYVGSMSASATADDTELCEGESTTLHAVLVNGSGNYTFNWTPANTLDNPTSQHPVATPGLGTTTYTCQIEDVGWNNTVEVGVGVTVHPTYDETTIDTAICYGESCVFYGSIYDYTTQTYYTDHTIHGCDSIVRLNLTVYPPNDTIIIEPSICIGDAYDFHGTWYDQNGQIAYFDTIDNHGCLWVEKLVLTVDEYQMPPMLEQYECYPHGTTPGWTWDETGVTYHEDTYDEIVLEDPNGGCPFKYRLNLKFHEEKYMETSIDTCDMYFWPITGETYDGTQQIVKTFHQSFGDKECDSTYVLNLNITYSPTPDKIRCIDPGAVVFGAPNGTADTVAVVTNTEFFSFQYNFKVEEAKHDAPECTWDRCDWTIINKPSWTIMYDTIPKVSDRNGKYYSECTVYVAEHDDEYVVLTATMSNDCNSDTCRIYLKSSFLDIDEKNTAQSDFSIVPNPNNGQMTLVFNRFEGKTDVKVYDIMGNLVDCFETYNDLEYKVLEYNLNSRKGMFFFVANGKGGTITKKVVIQ